jgi:hemoglobin/transferrin/lactoferrin receptor protein
MKVFLVMLLATVVSSLGAQTIVVKDKDTFVPLELVTITSQNPSASVITNTLGQADISGFKQSQIIEVRIIGYSPQIFSYKELELLNFTVLLWPSVFSIDQVVVSATRWKQPSIEIPVRIRLISSKQVGFHNPQTSADLLEISGDVFIQKSQQGGGSPMIRGFASNRLLIAVDGVRMNNAIFRSGNLQNVISLDPFAIERTEVLFGPGSVIYGSDAIGGVMSFYTLSPRHSNGDKPLVAGNFTTRYSFANSEKAGHIDLNLGWEKWAMLTSFTYTNFGNVRMGSNGPSEYLRNEYVKRDGDIDIVVANPNPKIQRPTAYAQSNFMQKLSFKPNSQWELTYGLHYSASSDFDRYDRLLAYKDGLPRSAQWYYGPQVWLMNSLNINTKAKRSAYDELTFNVAHQLFKESRNYRNFNSNILRNRFEEVLAFSGNLDFIKSVGSSQRFIYGIESIYNDVNSFGLDKNILTDVEINGPARYPKSQWSSYAVYLTYQRKITEKVNLQAGGRYNRFILNAEFDNTFYPFPFSTTTINKGALTGSMGLTIRPTKQWRINTNLSTGFRSPNVDDMGKVFDSTPGSVVVPTPNLNAEYAYNAEISITKVFGDFLEVDFLAFATYLDNAMVRRDATFNGQDSIVYAGELSRVQSIQNAASAKVWGIQADFELKLTQQLLLSSRYNYQRGFEEIDNGAISPLRHAAPWFGVTSITYNYSKIRLMVFANFSGEVSYGNLAQEERDKPYIYAINKDGNPYSPSWYTLNFRGQYQARKSILVIAGIENITDRRYRPYSSGMVAHGVNFTAALKVSF